MNKNGYNIAMYYLRDQKYIQCTTYTYWKT